jgi:hypothetical protein
MRQHVIMAGGGSAIVVGSGSWQRGLAVSVADLPGGQGHGIRPARVSTSAVQSPAARERVPARGFRFSREVDVAQ